MVDFILLYITYLLYKNNLGLRSSFCLVVVDFVVRHVTSRNNLKRRSTTIHLYCNRYDGTTMMLFVYKSITTERALSPPTARLLSSFGVSHLPSAALPLF